MNIPLSAARTRVPKLRPLAAVLLVASVSGICLAQPADGPVAPPPAAAVHVARIENGFGPIDLGKSAPPLALDITMLMHMYNVPGMSVAVIDGYKVVWAKAYGVTKPGGTAPVTLQTLFQAGSLSKPVATVGTLSLVQAGKLSLDEDVNQRLTSWKVPENVYTRTQKVTLRRIMSHTSGLSVHGFSGYAVDEPRPTLLQILDGEKPANSAAVRVQHVPGMEWHYSGGGVLVEQQLVTDTTHEPFPQFMREAVFDKIGMHDSTYEQPLPAWRAADAASGTYYDGMPVHGGWHVYPEMAAAGLWSTPSDLAKFLIEIALSRQGKANHVLTQAMATEMLKPQFDPVGETTWGDQRHPDRMGLGFFLGDATRPDRFGHIGDDEGFQAMMIMFGDSGQGAVIMANSQQGIRVGRLLLNNIAEEYGWNYQPPEGRIDVNTRLLALAKFRGMPAAMRYYSGLKQAADASVGKNTLVRLGYDLYAAGGLRDAIQVMRQAVREYPDYWNAYDSLAEMYADAGDRQRAIENYEKAIALNPGDQDGKAALERLRASPAHGA